MSLGQILKKRRMELNLTLDYVSSRAGFSKPYLSTIETGKVRNPPSDELLRKLEEILQFETGILLKIAHLERLPADVRQQYESAEAQNIKLRKMIRNIVELKADHNQVRSMLSKEDISQEEKPEIVKAGTVVPIINKVAAGYPTDFTDLEYPVGVAEDYIRCPDLHDPNAFAVRVVGDSMEPKFVEGDIVVFSPAAEVHNGDDCFIRFSMPHETTFKRVFFENEGRVRLQPRNEKYAPIIVEGKRIDGVYRAFSRTERL